MMPLVAPPGRSRLTANAPVNVKCKVLLSRSIHSQARCRFCWTTPMSAVDQTGLASHKAMPTCEVTHTCNNAHLAAGSASDGQLTVTCVCSGARSARWSCRDIHVSEALQQVAVDIRLAPLLHPNSSQQVTASSKNQVCNADLQTTFDQLQVSLLKCVWKCNKSFELWAAALGGSCYDR